MTGIVNKCKPEWHSPNAAASSTKTALGIDRSYPFSKAPPPKKNEHRWEKGVMCRKCRLRKLKRCHVCFLFTGDPMYKNLFKPYRKDEWKMYIKNVVGFFTRKKGRK